MEKLSKFSKIYLHFSIGLALLVGASQTSFADGPERKSQSVTDSFWNEAPQLLDANELKAIRNTNCPSITDMMEAWPTRNNWNLGFLKPKKRFAIQSDYRAEGDYAFSTTVKQGDAVDGHGKYKHELRIANKKRCFFGREVWYSFSFFVDGSYPTEGSTRWVIGQWKEDSDGSPFLAQRFDNGVFHITIQRNNKRVFLAAAPGNYKKGMPFLSKEFEKSLPFEKGQLPSGFNTYRQAQSLGRKAYQINALKEAILTQDIDKFPFVADPETFGKIEGLTIEPGDLPVLPDPTVDWVHMRYRVKGDRNGNGLIEVWANGNLITRAVGKIGNDEFDGDTQYFKIGHYRDAGDKLKRATLYFDRFRRGISRSNVD